jgi:hypothetical protein
LTFFSLYRFVPETRKYQLEQLDEIFSISSKEHAHWAVKHLAWSFRRLFRKDLKEPLLLPEKGNYMAQDRLDTRQRYVFDSEAGKSEREGPLYDI